MQPESYQRRSFWVKQYARTSTMKDPQHARYVLHLANFALLDGISRWARPSLRRTVCAGIRKYPELYAEAILLMGADSSRDLAWCGIMCDRVIMKCFRATLRGCSLSQIVALENAAKRRKENR